MPFWKNKKQNLAFFHEPDGEEEEPQEPELKVAADGTPDSNAEDPQ